eukprot:jgi/Bigna1/67604/fgenesh1_pg.4_\
MEVGVHNSETKKQDAIHGASPNAASGVDCHWFPTIAGAFSHWFGDLTESCESLNSNTWMLAIRVLEREIHHRNSYHPAPTPTWHLTARCAAGDVNALFQYKGIWHLMQQWGPNALTSIGHSVSRDLLRWRRIKNALSAGNTTNGTQECYDGSVSFVTGKDGMPVPMLMIDGGCGKFSGGNISCMESLGNGSTGGVTAWPEHPHTDPLLLRWKRAGPMVFLGCNMASGPSPIFEGAHGKHELIAIYGEAEGRFEATDDTLKHWRLADPSFLPTRGGGGGLWRKLPINVDGVEGGRWATHIFQANTPELGDGRATFQMAVFNPRASGGMKVENITPPLPVDMGKDVAYGQLSLVARDSNGPNDVDNRTIHVSWLIDWANFRPDCITSGQLTSFRDLRFDPRLGERGALVENPIEEYIALRGRQLFSFSNRSVPLTNFPAVLTPKDEATRRRGVRLVELIRNAGTVVDIELSIALEPESSREGGAAEVYSLGFRCETSHSCKNGTLVTFRITPRRNNDTIRREEDGEEGDKDEGKRGGASRGLTRVGVTRAVNMSVVTPSASHSMSFVLLEDETELPVRAMSDHRSIELFAAGGRGVFTGILNSTYTRFLAGTSRKADEGAAALSEVPEEENKLLRKSFSLSATGWKMRSIAG